MAENLHVKVSGEGEANLVLLHGLFGSANNLGQLARAFKGDHRVLSVDLPDHGKSAWLSSSSVETYSESVAQWLIENGIEHCKVIGHSLGGKVAMQLALDHPSLVERLVVLDIAPVAYPSRHDDVFNALKSFGADLPSIDINLSMNEAFEVLARHKAPFLTVKHEDEIVDYLAAQEINRIKLREK